MTVTRRTAGLAFALAAGLLLAGSRSSAQVVATTFDELRLQVSPGDEVYITDTTGKEMRASVIEVGRVLVLEMSGERQVFAAEDVWQIRQPQPDSLWTGAILGGLAGAAFGVVPLNLMSPPCVGIECGAPIIASAAAGAGIGVGLDALIRRRAVIYSAGGRRAASVSVMPLLSGHARGAAFAVRF